ncbi:MAG TPA: helix-turn-helix transcriptional regulator [Ktedonobacterales bacterium]|nr:helix-turn-helix transcriptional regulator [Ktedonobacterales bacterium]
MAERGQHGAERHEAVEYALLGLLRDGPGHGYRLAAAFGPSGRLGLIVRLKMSQLYAYLHKLERTGWLTMTDEGETAPDGQSGKEAGRMRRVFALTSAGENAFDAWLATPITATREMRLTFLLKLAFALHDPMQARTLVARQREASATWLGRLRAQEARVRSDGGEDAPVGQEERLIRLLTLRQRIRLSEATLAWLDETSQIIINQVD